MRRRYLNPLISTAILLLGALTSAVAQSPLWFSATCVLMVGANFWREYSEGSRARHELDAFKGLVPEMLDTAAAVIYEDDPHMCCSVWLPYRTSSLRRLFESASMKYNIDASASDALPILSPNCVCIAYRQRRLVLDTTPGRMGPRDGTIKWHFAIPILDIDDRIKVLGVLRVDGGLVVSPQVLEARKIEKKAVMVASQLGHLFSIADRLY